ncbi:MAG: endolytic transglycosylase MltG [Desulfovibrio sp.]|nr:endolytic transglycosylase MltG [Desulfovibrio sp.]
MKRFLRNICFLLLALAACGSALAAWDAHHFLTTPASAENKETLFSIRHGASLERVAADLAAAGVIADARRFRLLALLRNAQGRIQAGEFLVSGGWTPGRVLDQITSGRPFLHRLLVREGLSWWETANALEQQGFILFEDFNAVIHDPAFLREHHIPFGNAEGFLFPETYFLRGPRTPPDKKQARDIASMMVRMFWRRTAPLWNSLPPRQGVVLTAAGRAASHQAPPLPANSTLPGANATLTPGCPLPEDLPAKDAWKDDGPQQPSDVDETALSRLVILASLVEKETGVPPERPRVAGVYANRLRLGMLLQCDPTIIYGLGPAFSGPIRRSQIRDPANPYNTYAHAGLPPGPICSPSLASLLAAALPEKHGFLYFVATGQGDGGHVFSRTISEHNAAVRRYRARLPAGGD